MRERGGLEGWAIDVFAACSQLANAFLFNGHPNETISGRCYRENRKWAVRIIDTLFFFDPHHCMGSHLKDLRWANWFLLVSNENQ